MRLSESAWHRYRAKMRAWARRSNEAQAAARLLREPDFETQRRRALEDRRGTVVREGATYSASGVTHWQVRHALRPGRVDQFDLVADGAVVRTCCARRLPRRFRP